MDGVDAVERAVGDDAGTRVDGTTDRQGAVNGADVLVDATDGSVASRRELLADAEPLLATDPLVVTGDPRTSVTGVAAGLQAPGRAVGLSLVDPEESALVEVVLADQTTAATRADAVAFVEGLDRVPIVVRDAPGFAAARLELARIAEAIRLVEAGVTTVEGADRAATRTTDERGPLARADELGLDAVLGGLDDLHERLGDRFEPPSLLREAVEAGTLGKRTGEGFYTWSNGEPAGPGDLGSEPSAREGTEGRPDRP